MILVTGTSGFVGNKIMQVCKDVIAAPSLRNISEDEVRRIVQESGADTVIHTAAISDIGECEKDPEASYNANVLLPVYLAKASKNIKLICFSSDQVYSGTEADTPFTEDMVNPTNVYARHKLEMENRVLDIDPDAVMLRAEWMYDRYLKKGNYFMNILNAKDSVSFSSNQYRGITYVKEVAENMEKVARLPGGAYNFGSETAKSMYEITKDFLALIGKNITLNDSPARQNLWMDCGKARRYSVDFSLVEDGLKKCAKDYGLI
ncbi:MAG: NAD-dependent epimerase/dehydratase family protein [Ruminococcaceae bacterium]|nr:NAD-dependent epimerase/dehydratase family protein [Oscillospiraceae bacterium]